jgi:hypothetical protein
MDACFISSLERCSRGFGRITSNEILIELNVVVFYSKALLFMTPGLPFVPAIAVMVNFYLILKLSILTLVRFTIWMTLGMTE